MLNDHFIRVSGIRPVKVMTKKEKQEREVSWNPRFYVDRMPEYNASKDKYLQSLLSTLKQKKIIVVHKSKKVRIRSPKSIQKSNSSKRFSHSTMKVNYLQTLSRLKQEIESVYIAKGIPIDFFKILSAATEDLDLKYAVSVLHKVFEDLQVDRDTLQTALKAVKARERFLQQLEEVSAQGLIDRKDAVEYISNLAIYSIRVVESIGQWKSELSELNPKMLKPHFAYHGENYLLKMTQDTQFLKASKIAVLLGEKHFEGFIPSFCEKKFKNFTKRVNDAEVKLIEEIHPAAKESLFELRNKKKTVERVVSEIDFGQMDFEGLQVGGIEGEVLELVQEYNKSVPEQVRNCLGDPVAACSKSVSLKFPAYFWVRWQELCVGMFVLNLEMQKTLQKRLFLSHVSAVSMNILDKVINVAIDYCKTNYPCDEIRVALSSPQNAEGKFESDKSIKQHFDKLGFRWKVLIKDGTDFPVHILGLSIKKQENSPNQQIFQDSIQLFYSCTGQQSETKASCKGIFSAVGVSTVLKKMEVSGQGASKCVEIVMSKANATWNPPAFKVSSLKDLDSLRNDTVKLGLNITGLEEKETCLALASVELNWVRFLTTSWKNTKFLYIHGCEIDVMSSKSALVYIIPTEDPAFNAFLIPVSGKIEEPIERSKEILSEIFEVKQKISEIWIPEFRVERQNRVGIREEDKSFICQENIAVHINAALHREGNLKLVPERESLVICGNFLFGVINSKVDEEFEVPYLAIYVQTSDFIPSD